MKRTILAIAVATASTTTMASDFVDHIIDAADPYIATQAEFDDAVSQGADAYNDLDGRINSTDAKVDNYAQQGEAAYNDLDSRTNKNKAGIDMNRASIDDFKRESNAAMGAVQNDVRELRSDVDDLTAGVAAAVAAASHQFDVGAGAGGQMSLAGGYYSGENAVSLAMGAPLGERTFVNVNVSHDSRGNQAFGAGVNFKLW